MLFCILLVKFMVFLLVLSKLLTHGHLDRPVRRQSGFESQTLQSKEIS